MNRRGLFQSLLGLLAVPFVGASASANAAIGTGRRAFQQFTRGFSVNGYVIERRKQPSISKLNVLNHYFYDSELRGVKKAEEKRQRDLRRISLCEALKDCVCGAGSCALCDKRIQELREMPEYQPQFVGPEYHARRS